MNFNKFLLATSVLIFAAVLFFVPDNAYTSTNEMLEDALNKINPTLNGVPGHIKRVAVYGFKPDRKGEVNINSLKDQLITILMDTGRFQVIDRDMLEDLMREQDIYEWDHKNH